jgi:hypothetical protein
LFSPVILGTWEADIRIEVPGHPEQTFSKTTSEAVTAEPGDEYLLPQLPGKHK